MRRLLDTNGAWGLSRKAFLAFAACVVLCACGCSGPDEAGLRQQGEPTGSASAEGAGIGQASPGEGEADGSDEAEPASFADECLDHHGNLTAYALCELDGAQLCALLEQQYYVWSERSQMWVRQDGSAAVLALDAQGEHLTREAMEALGVGCEQAAVSYRLVSSGYGTAQKAFDALVGKAMACKNLSLVDSGAVGVAEASQARCLALVTPSDKVFVLTLVSEGAVQAGMLEALCGRELGTTLEEVVQSLAAATLSEGQGT